MYPKSYLLLTFYCLRLKSLIDYILIHIKCLINNLSIKNQIKNFLLKMQNFDFNTKYETRGNIKSENG